jgi:hypothetical protein
MMISRHISQSRIPKVVASAVLLSLVLGCAGGDVKQTLMLPQIQDIQLWSVVSHLDSLPPGYSVPQTLFEQEFEARYTNREVVDAYLDSVRYHLRSRGLRVLDDGPTQGRIILRLQGSRFLFRDTGVMVPAEGYNRNDIKDLDEDPDEPFDGNRGNRLRPEYAAGDPRDKLVLVDIDFFDSNSKLLGNASIEGDDIKPRRVAEVIRKLIETGEY